jgi:hypothetical protein
MARGHLEPAWGATSQPHVSIQHASNAGIVSNLPFAHCFRGCGQLKSHACPELSWSQFLWSRSSTKLPLVSYYVAFSTFVTNFGGFPSAYFRSRADLPRVGSSSAATALDSDLCFTSFDRKIPLCAGSLARWALPKKAFSVPRRRWECATISGLQRKGFKSCT